MASVAQQAVLDALRAKVAGRAPAGSVPVLYTLHMAGGQAGLQEVPVFPGSSRSGSLADCLSRIAGGPSAIADVTPDLYGAAFLCRARRPAAGGSGSRPGQAGYLLCAVDRAGTTYEAWRGDGDIAACAAVSQAPWPLAMTAITGALDALVQSMLGVALPPRPPAAH